MLPGFSRILHPAILESGSNVVRRCLSNSGCHMMDRQVGTVNSWSRYPPTNSWAAAALALVAQISPQRANRLIARREDRHAAAADGASQCIVGSTGVNPH